MQRFYGRVLPRSSIHRISDFDGDLKLDVNLGETIGVNLWQIPQLYEPAERKLFCSAITPDCTVLDVGANIGIYTLLAAKRRAKVIAVEADPGNATRLRHHLDLNRLDESVTVIEVAALDRTGPVSLRRNPNNSGGSAVVAGGSISAATIDSLNLPPIDICKMDIEGSELKALNGMLETLGRSPRMKLLVEYNSLSDQAGLLAFLMEHFSHIAVAGRGELRVDQHPPSDCNLWCWN